MNQLTLVDLDNSQALAHQAMCDLTGGAEWELRSSTVVNGAWSAYSKLFVREPYGTIHDGYRALHTYEGFKRTRLQTEYSYWLHTVRL